MNNLDLKLPPITITSADMRRLNVLALSDAPPAESLAREIDRANIVPVHQAMPELVRMGSLVKYRENTTGQVREVTLVYPREADVEANRVSVLTPFGAALIGLSVGQTMEFETPHGEKLSLTVLQVDAEQWSATAIA
jgi:regulator of nucleoside diphosphate kinase